MTSLTTLLLSQRHLADDQALWRAAVQRGWAVERARGIRLPEISDEDIVIYVEALYAPTIAKALQRHLIDPPEDWLATLPERFCRRSVKLISLKEARNVSESAFVKPPNDKSFQAKVYTSGADLPAEFDDEMLVLIAEPVEWLNEYRCFMLEGKVKTLSPYWLDGVHAESHDYAAPEAELRAALQFAEQVAADSASNVPKAVVLDVGIIENRGWAVVEANGAWGSGIYGCNPDAALDVIRAATVPISPSSLSQGLSHA